jgi:hypothetical protein
MSSDLPGVDPATLNGILLYYRLMTKWSGLRNNTKLSRVGLSQDLRLHNVARDGLRPPAPVSGILSSRRGIPLFELQRRTGTPDIFPSPPRPSNPEGKRGSSIPLAAPPRAPLPTTATAFSRRQEVEPPPVMDAVGDGRGRGWGR